MINNDKRIELKYLLDKIKANKLILPDFQREYVWIEEDKITDFIASILAQIPIGTLITFKQKSNQFANKVLGFNKSIKFSDLDDEVEYLLDGQQRLTTLCLFFSDRIFEKIDSGDYKPKDLMKQAMKLRYMIRMPKYDGSGCTNDFFGYLDLVFPFEPKRVDFCTDQVTDLIDSRPFNFASNAPKEQWHYYRNYKNLKRNEKFNYVDKIVDDAVIPLYFLVDNQEGMLDKIIEKMGDKRAERLKELYNEENYDELLSYINGKEEYQALNDYINDEQSLINEFKDTVDELKDKWIDSMQTYLKACMNLSIQLIEVDDEEPARAINIYEALNKGGVRLTTFDLIIAKAANRTYNENEDTYYQKIRKIIAEYNNPELLQLLNLQISDWNADDYLRCSNKDKVSPIMIKQFLNLLTILANFTDSDGNPLQKIDTLKTDYCKEKKQLELTTSQIWDYSFVAMKSVCDALLIMQAKFGIFEIGQINYNLMLLPVAYSCFLMKKGNYEQLDKIKIIEKITAWYWYALFGGEYNYDQSTNVINHIKLLHNWIVSNEKPSKFNSTNITKTLDNILNVDKYNNFEVLSYQSDYTCKKAVKEAIMQYILSKCPDDFVVDENGNSMTIHAWDRLRFEAHHCIPLGTVTNLKQSTKEIRNKKDKLINSPLNMAFISPNANKAISDRSVAAYYSYLPNTFQASYLFNDDITQFNYDINDSNSESKLKDILQGRYTQIKSDIIYRVKQLIESN